MTHHALLSLFITLFLAPLSHERVRLVATASEPLTLDEEYVMQQSWHLDEDKCTFIILANEDIHISNAVLKPWKDYPMVGDVNLFFNDVDHPHTAEVELMIAEPTFRRKGIGKQALSMMLLYGVMVTSSLLLSPSFNSFMRLGYEDLGVKEYTAKIGMDNVASQRLFQKHLGFAFREASQVFQEVTLTLLLNDDTVEALQGWAGIAQKHVYE